MVESALLREMIILLAKYFLVFVILPLCSFTLVGTAQTPKCRCCTSPQTTRHNGTEVATFQCTFPAHSRTEEPSASPLCEIFVSKSVLKLAEGLCYLETSECQPSMVALDFRTLERSWTSEPPSGLYKCSEARAHETGDVETGSIKGTTSTFAGGKDRLKLLILTKRWKPRLIKFTFTWDQTESESELEEPTMAKQLVTTAAPKSLVQSPQAQQAEIRSHQKPFALFIILAIVACPVAIVGCWMLASHTVQKCNRQRPDMQDDCEQRIRTGSEPRRLLNFDLLKVFARTNQSNQQAPGLHLASKSSLAYMHVDVQDNWDDNCNHGVVSGYLRPVPR